MKGSHVTNVEIAPCGRAVVRVCVMWPSRQRRDARWPPAAGRAAIISCVACNRGLPPQSPLFPDHPSHLHRTLPSTRAPPTNSVVFVADLTEGCGTSCADQWAIRQELRQRCGAARGAARRREGWRRARQQASLRCHTPERGLPPNGASLHLVPVPSSSTSVHLE